MASISKISCSAIDDTWGPHAEACRGGLDFTLLFEETILTILPLAVVLCLIPLRVIYLSRRLTKVNSGILLPAKLVRLQILSSQYLLKPSNRELA